MFVHKINDTLTDVDQDAVIQMPLKTQGPLDLQAAGCLA
jgi:hypothetical protein